MHIHRFTFNHFGENTYVAYDETLACVIIDPGCNDKEERQELVDFISSNKLEVKLLLNTHCHADHVVGNAFIKKTYNVPLAIHALDAPTLKAVELYAPMYGFHGFESHEADVFLEEGKDVQFGNSSFEVLFVPGHAPGHVAFVNRSHNYCISGDVLFRESVGRTDLPGGNTEQLMRTIRSKMYSLPNEMVVFPGHGDTTTIGHEKKYNPFCPEN